MAQHAPSLLHFAQLPADNILLGENATEDNYIEPPEEVITLAELKVTGDRVVVCFEAASCCHLTV